MNERVNQTQAVATLQPSRMPIAPALAKEFGISSADWRVLLDQVFPGAKTPEAIAMALSYCRSRKLDIFKRPVHIVPMYSSVLKKMVETVWPGIAEVRTTASRTGEYAGIDDVVFGPMVEKEFEGEKEVWENGRSTGRFETMRETIRFPEWASVTVYRIVGGSPRAFTAKVYWEEAYASNGKTGMPNAMWTKRPRGQLDKCVEAAALRKAFPEEVGNELTAEEMEGRTIDHAPLQSDPFGLLAAEAAATAPRRSGPPSAPPAPSAPAAPLRATPELPVIDQGEETDTESGEFINPDEVIAAAEEALGALDDLAEVRSTFDSFFAYYEEKLTPMDWDRLVAVRDRNVAHL